MQTKYFVDSQSCNRGSLDLTRFRFAPFKALKSNASTRIAYFHQPGSIAIYYDADDTSMCGANRGRLRECARGEEVHDTEHFRKIPATTPMVLNCVENHVSRRHHGKRGKRSGRRRPIRDRAVGRSALLDSAT